MIRTEHVRADGQPTYAVNLRTEPDGYGVDHPFAAAWAVGPDLYTVRVGATVVGTGSREHALATLERAALGLAARGLTVTS